MAAERSVATALFSYAFALPLHVHAALARSVSCSIVVALKLGRASSRAIHQASRLGWGAVSVSHSSRFEYGIAG
jgi:hypothetical protein